MCISQELLSGRVVPPGSAGVPPACSSFRYIRRRLRACTRGQVLSPPTRLDSCARLFHGLTLPFPRGHWLLLPNGEAPRHLQLHQRGDLLSPPWRLTGIPGCRPGEDQFGFLIGALSRAAPGRSTALRRWTARRPRSAAAHPGRPRYGAGEARCRAPGPHCGRPTQSRQSVDSRCAAPKEAGNGRKPNSAPGSSAWVSRSSRPSPASDCRSRFDTTAPADLDSRPATSLTATSRSSSIFRVVRTAESQPEENKT